MTNSGIYSSRDKNFLLHEKSKAVWHGKVADDDVITSHETATA